MDKVFVLANVEDAYIEADFEGWVEPDDWRKACDECAVPVHVTRVISLHVKEVGGIWFPPGAETSYLIGEHLHSEAEELLRHKWLSGAPDWRPYVFGTELREIEPPSPPPGAVPLLEDE